MAQNNEIEQNEKDFLDEGQNLFGFFELLLKVDKRVNPHLYKKTMIEKEQKND